MQSKVCKEDQECNRYRIGIETLQRCYYIENVVSAFSINVPPVQYRSNERQLYGKSVNNVMQSKVCKENQEYKKYWIGIELVQRFYFSSNDWLVFASELD